MNDTLQTIIIAVIGSGALSALIAGIFNLIANRKNRLAKIETQLESINAKLLQTEKDELRTQLLLMISDYPHETQEILTLAERYFTEPPEGLGGNWYATSIFNSWLEQNGIARPEWFRKEKK